MNLIRKTVLHVETTYIDGGKVAPTPLKMVAAAAVIKNPWAGQGYVENLAPEIRRIAPILSEHLTRLILEEVGSGEGYKPLVKVLWSDWMANLNTPLH